MLPPKPVPFLHPGPALQRSSEPHLFQPLVISLRTQATCALLPKLTVKFPESCYRAASFKGASRPCPGSTDQHFPGCVLVLTLASGAFLSSLGKDAGEEDGSSGEAKALLGTTLREVDAPVWPCPALDCTHPWPQQSFGAGKNGSQTWGLQEAEVSTFQGSTFPPQKAPADRRPGPPRRLRWKPGMWGPGTSSLPAELLELLVSAQWGLTWEPSLQGYFRILAHCLLSMPGSQPLIQLRKGPLSLLADKTHQF